LKILLIIFLAISYLNLPVLAPAKEIHLHENKNETNDSESPRLVKRSQPSYDMDEVTVSAESYILLSSIATEEIMTQADSVKVFAFYPAISISVTPDRNQMDAGQQVQRILQELLPLNIF